MIESSKSCHFNRSDSAVWLVDNGSLRAQSILALRVQAASLSELAGIAVEPVSVLHSGKVPPEQLEGQAAVTFTPYLRACAGRGLSRLLVVPYFFGPSAALTDYLPQQIARVQAEYPHLQVRIAPPLVDLAQPQDDAPEVLAGLLAAQIGRYLDAEASQPAAAATQGALQPSVSEAETGQCRIAGALGAAKAPAAASISSPPYGRSTTALPHLPPCSGHKAAIAVTRLPAVVMVDHGSPQPAVSAVRECVGGRLWQLLAGRVAAFATCSMEAREGAEYAHTLPLLEQVLGQEPFCTGRVIVAPLFLGPGRHAGEGGDLWQIAESVRQAHPALEVTFCPLPGGSAEVTALLLRRLQSGMVFFTGSSAG